MAIAPRTIRLLRNSVLGLTLLLGGAARAHADDQADNVELMRKLYAKLADLLTVDSGALGRSGTHLVLKPAGGFLLDPRLHPDSDPDDRRVLITNFLDIRLRESWLFSTAPDPMSTIYRAVLRDAMTPKYQSDHNGAEGVRRDRYHALRQSSQADPIAEGVPLRRRRARGSVDRCADVAEHEPRQAAASRQATGA